ncbi:hypothetical protein [Duganella sp. BuS-21]|uniref:hypothetical protein n=1 Tax=Duganella sp. BuS-21 TaxID=2943848 RepID=UPI0035A5FCDF
MKHLKFLPFLIAAVSYMPRSHAAEVVQTTEPSGLSLLLICLSLVVLAGAGHTRSAVIKPEQ